MEKQTTGVIEKIVQWAEFRPGEQQTIATAFVAHHKLPKKSVPDMLRVFNISKPSFVLGVDGSGKAFSRLADRKEAEVVAILIKEYIL